MEDDLAKGHEIEIPKENLMMQGMEILDTTLAGISTKYGGEIASKCLLQHFIVMLKVLKSGKQDDDVKEILQYLKEELEPNRIDIDFEVRCCPKKKKKV